MIKVQILGLNGHTATNSLAQNIINAVERLGIIIKLEEVNDIDGFVNYDLSAVPALAINGQLAFEQNIPSVEDLMDLLSGYAQPMKLRA